MAHSDLDWACRLVFEADGAAVTLPEGAATRPWPRAQSFLVLPRPARARLLVPLEARAAAAAALRRSDTGSGSGARLARAILAAGLRSGLGPGLGSMLGRRLVVTVDPALAAGGRSGALLRDHLRAVLDRPDLELAVILGPPRLNRKPVLQLLDRRGKVIGYTKAGWNDLTRELVRNEARELTALAEDPPSTFVAPRLLHHGPWGGLELIVVSALPVAVAARRDRVAEPPLASLREIAHRPGVTEGSLADSPYWTGVLGRAADRAAGLAGADDGLAAIAAHVEDRHGATVLRFGGWHGDLAPWNLSERGGRVHLWDWERAASPVPLGLDLVHFLFQRTVRYECDDVLRAAELARARVAGLLQLVGGDPATEEALWSLYSVELLLRYGAPRPEGVFVPPSAIHAGINDLFSAAIASAGGEGGAEPEEPSSEPAAALAG